MQMKALFSGGILTTGQEAFAPDITLFVLRHAQHRILPEVADMADMAAAAGAAAAVAAVTKIAGVMREEIKEEFIR